MTMAFQPQERSQTQIDVVTPRATRANLRPLDQAELLDTAMVVFNRPRETRPLDSLHVVHLNLPRGPQFDVAVCGDYLEHTDFEYEAKTEEGGG